MVVEAEAETYVRGLVSVTSVVELKEVVPKVGEVSLEPKVKKRRQQVS